MCGQARVLGMPSLLLCVTAACHAHPVTCCPHPLLLGVTLRPLFNIKASCCPLNAISEPTMPFLQGIRHPLPVWHVSSGAGRRLPARAARLLVSAVFELGRRLLYFESKRGSAASRAAATAAAAAAGGGGTWRQRRGPRPLFLKLYYIPRNAFSAAAALQAHCAGRPTLHCACRTLSGPLFALESRG